MDVMRCGCFFGGNSANAAKADADDSAPIRAVGLKQPGVRGHGGECGGECCFEGKAADTKAADAKSGEAKLVGFEGRKAGMRGGCCFGGNKANAAKADADDSAQVSLEKRSAEVK